jgi:hypothetical protein
MIPRIGRALPRALLLGSAGLAQRSPAEVWGYVDADGTAHVATQKLDERYQLFFRGKTNADVTPGAARDGAADLDTLRATGIYKRMVDVEHRETPGVDEKRAAWTWRSSRR